MTLDDWTQRVEANEQWVRRAAWVVLVAGILSFVVRGGDRPANPMLTNASRRPLPGFPSVAFQIVTADKRYLDWCALLAATQQAREQGLMGQSDLRGYEAMLFRFPAETDTVYYMFGTTLPLSIAWFDGDGAFVAAKDMDPCGENDPDACADYLPPRKYRYALEVARGDLERLGIGPGSKIAFPYESCI